MLLVSCWLSVSCQYVVGQLLVGCWPAGRFLVSCWSVVGSLSVSCQYVVGQLLVGCWLVVSQLSVC